MTSITDLRHGDHKNVFEQGEFVRLPSGEIVLYQDRAHPPTEADRVWHLVRGSPATTDRLVGIRDMWTVTDNRLWEGGLVAPHGRAMDVEDFARPAAIGVIQGIVTKIRANEIPTMSLEIRSSVCALLEELVDRVSPAPTVAEDPREPTCPRCSNRSDLRIKESHVAYHHVQGIEGGQLHIQNALTAQCPSEWFDEGAGDYVACCGNCGHAGPLTTFGIDDDAASWVWL